MKLGLRTDKPMYHGLPKEAAQKAEDQLTFNIRMLQAMDMLSLAACCTKPPGTQTQDVMPQPGAAPMRLNLRRDGNDVVVDPWPFNEAAVEVMIPATRVGGKAYANADALKAAIREGGSEIINCRFLSGHLE